MNKLFVLSEIHYKDCCVLFHIFQVYEGFEVKYSSVPGYWVFTKLIIKLIYLLSLLTTSSAYTTHDIVLIVDYSIKLYNMTEL